MYLSTFIVRVSFIIILSLKAYLSTIVSQFVLSLAISAI
jgi:hypothetical protein